MSTIQEIKEKFDKEFPPSVISWVSTGSLAFDYIFGGGFPLSKLVLLSSEPGLGKTISALSIANGILSQDSSKHVLYIDSEKALDSSLLNKALGDRASRVIVHTPCTYEDTEEIISEYAGKGIMLVVLDSITALQPKSVIDDKSGRLGAKASAEPLFLTQLRNLSHVHSFGVLMLNHFRASIDVRSRKSGLRPAGGLALHHYCDYLVTMNVVEFLYDVARNKVGACVKVSCEKNRIVGNRSAYTYLKYGVGISNLYTICSLLKVLGYAVSSGAYFKILIPGMEEKNVLGNSGLEKFVCENYDSVIKLFVPEVLEKAFMEFKKS